MGDSLRAGPQYGAARKGRKLAASAPSPDIVTQVGSALARNNLSLAVPYSAATGPADADEPDVYDECANGCSVGAKHERSVVALNRVSLHPAAVRKSTR